MVINRGSRRGNDYFRALGPVVVVLFDLLKVFVVFLGHLLVNRLVLVNLGCVVELADVVGFLRVVVLEIHVNS